MITGPGPAGPSGYTEGGIIEVDRTDSKNAEAAAAKLLDLFGNLIDY